MKLSEIFKSNVKDSFGKDGENWLNNLPFIINRISAKHQLRFIDLLPGLTYHFVGLFEITHSGETAILKMAPNNQYIANELHWLECFDQSVPQIYFYDDEFSAILMERLIPGHTLKKLVQEGKDDQSTKIICKIIRNLQTHQHQQYSFKHLSELIGSLDYLSGQLDEKLISKAKLLFTELTSDRSNDVILHGDLHHDNILASNTNWKVIDPHGYIGDPAHEVGSMIYNPFDFFPQHQPIISTIKRRLEILIDELPFDHQRIKSWAFCKAMLSAAWTVEDRRQLPDFEKNIIIAIDEAIK